MTVTYPETLTNGNNQLHASRDHIAGVIAANPGFELLIHVPIWIACCVNLNGESWHSGNRGVESAHEFMFRLCIVRPFPQIFTC